MSVIVSTKHLPCARGSVLGLGGYFGMYSKPLSVYEPITMVILLKMGSQIILYCLWTSLKAFEKTG